MSVKNQVEGSGFKGSGFKGSGFGGSGFGVHVKSEYVSTYAKKVTMNAKL